MDREKYFLNHLFGGCGDLKTDISLKDSSLFFFDRNNFFMHSIDDKVKREHKITLLYGGKITVV